MKDRSRGAIRSDDPRSSVRGSGVSTRGVALRPRAASEGPRAQEWPPRGWNRRETSKGSNICGIPRKKLKKIDDVEPRAAVATRASRDTPKASEATATPPPSFFRCRRNRRPSSSSIVRSPSSSSSSSSSSSPSVKSLTTRAQKTVLGEVSRPFDVAEESQAERRSMPPAPRGPAGPPAAASRERDKHVPVLSQSKALTPRPGGGTAEDGRRSLF